jgi:hypothetical protein
MGTNILHNGNKSVTNSQIASWVLVCSLPWVQHKKWIPIRSMECVHTHQKIPTIDGCGSLSHVQNFVEKTREDNQKVGKTNQVVSQMPTLRP